MYQVVYLDSVVKKDIPGLGKSDRENIKRAIERKLMVDPVGFGKPLQYSLKGCRRLRVRAYRVIFRIEPETMTVVVVKIGHRREVYD